MGSAPQGSGLPAKFDSNGNILSNLSAQSITPNVTVPSQPSWLKTDSSGNVLSNLSAQSITPNVTVPSQPSWLKTDSSGNVLSNLNAQNLDPVVASVSGAVTTANPYAPALLSHQTELSVTASAANTAYNIGSSISIPKNGIAKITAAVHVNGGGGLIQMNLTRGGKTYSLGAITNGAGSSLFSANEIGYFNNTSSLLANYSISFNPGSFGQPYSSNPFVLEIPVLSGDSLQFQVGNTTAGYIVYIDDLVVTLQ